LTTLRVDGMGGVVDLDAYVRERDGEWRRLENLTRRRNRLEPGEADELIRLYQRAATHLSVVRSRTPDPVLVARLSAIVLAARAAVIGGRRFSWRPIQHFLTVGFPLEVYRARWWWISVAVLSTILSGALIEYVAAHPEIPLMFIDQEQIDRLVSNDFVSYYSENHAQNFALRVWTNNALIAAQCLASGVLLLPVIYLLWQNILNVGLTGGVMVGHGRGDVFYSMIAPHGLLELTCIFVGAGVGLRIGWAWIAPGPLKTRGQALAERARSGMVVAVGLGLALLVAGLVEAFVTPSPLPSVVRIAMGAAVWLAFLAYWLVLGWWAERQGGSADLAEELRGADLPTA
jgi:uncharacterized membrane protein SpoIIM required for sporulation